MTVRRYFTLEEARALLPEVRVIVAEQLARRADLERRLVELGELVGEAPEDLSDKEGDAPAVLSAKRTLREHVDRYQQGWNRLETMGVVLKDARTGLVDFYSRVDGRVVYLCWQHDEPTIEHYHGLEEGFAGRKRIEGAVAARLYN
ncbi:MAG: DUF2203 domain-containing protein [Myxococcales bacterium]|nr:DUF2203 domain-containing protein [Myxococcales bacterium]